MPKILRGIAVPPFSDNPEDFADLGVEVEQAGFDGYFLWDHMVFSNSGEGPPILDPWLILAVVATRTSKIKIGTMVTPVPGRRPLELAQETGTDSAPAA
jgi:alkanesulfonate monooxygenase SsuD/methylene tetrahydromethanopterin reductase-like flavin-dependent oxidoreductase (luciferase family)